VPGVESETRDSTVVAVVCIDNAAERAAEPVVILERPSVAPGIGDGIVEEAAVQEAALLGCISCPAVAMCFKGIQAFVKIF